MRFYFSSFCWFSLSWSTFLDEKLNTINHFYEYASTGQKTIKSHLCALSMISTQSSPTFTFDFLRWHANRRVNQTFIWRGFFLDLLQVCISIFSNFIPIWFWHLYEVPLSHGAQEKEPKVRSVVLGRFSSFLHKIIRKFRYLTSRWSNFQKISDSLQSKHIVKLVEDPEIVL